MAEGIRMKESLAMARARELNRTNEKRLNDEMNVMLQDLRKKMEKIKIERKCTREFITKLKSSSGASKNSLMPTISEESHLESLIKPKPKMKFGFADYKSKKAAQSSHSLVVQPITAARDPGNPIPLRTVHSWTSTTARVIGRHKPPQISHPGRRSSVDSSEASSDDDEIFSDLITEKQRHKNKLLRRQSLPIINESTKSKPITTQKPDTEKTPKKTFLSKIKRRHSTLNF